MQNQSLVNYPPPRFPSFFRPRPPFRPLLRLGRRCLPGLLTTGLLGLVHHGAFAQTLSSRTEALLSETGTASFYGRRHQGRRSADGSRFDQEAMTGAHPWLPFGTRVRVTAMATGRSVIVTITDRMGAPRRIIDLSVGAARRLGIVQQGIARVWVTASR